MLPGYKGKTSWSLLLMPL